MKLRNIIFPVAGVLLFVLSSCVDTGSNGYDVADFEKKTSFGFYEGGTTIYSMNKSKDQLYFNSNTNVFRLTTDDGTKYAEVKFDRPIPAKGQKLKGTVTNNGLGNLKNYESIEFEVRKKTRDTCWLWSEQAGLGVIIMYVI